MLILIYQKTRCHIQKTEFRYHRENKISMASHSHLGLGTRDGFFEYGKGTFVSITGQGFVEQQSELRSSWMFLIPSKTRDLLSSRANFSPHECFCSVELNFVEKSWPNSWHKLLSYAVITDVLLTKWSKRQMFLLSDIKLHHTFARSNEQTEFSVSCYCLRVRLSYLKR